MIWPVVSFLIAPCLCRLSPHPCCDAPPLKLVRVCIEAATDRWVWPTIVSRRWKIFRFANAILGYFRRCFQYLSKIHSLLNRIFRIRIPKSCCPCQSLIDYSRCTCRCLSGHFQACYILPWYCHYLFHFESMKHCYCCLTNSSPSQNRIYLSSYLGYRTPPLIQRHHYRLELSSRSQNFKPQYSRAGRTLFTFSFLL